jgi:hypothetical protein
MLSGIVCRRTLKVKATLSGNDCRRTLKVKAKVDVDFFRSIL